MALCQSQTMIQIQADLVLQHFYARFYLRVLVDFVEFKN